MFWPRLGEVSVTELIGEHLLPLAYEGLDRFGVDPAIRDRLLGVIEGRCRTRRNGATWQADLVHRLEKTDGVSRASALREMLQRYIERQAENVPVHTWSFD
jgi:hypothetical protein